MSGAPVPPEKLSIGDRLRQRLRLKSRASSPTPAPASTQTSTSSAAPSQGSLLTQNLALSNPPSAGQVTANPPNPCILIPPSQPATTKPSSSDNIFEIVRKRLSDNDWAILENFIPLTSGDIDSALKQAVAAAKEKQRCCLEERWKIALAGKEFILKEKANKIVRWLNRFKDVGDVAAAADPVHAGLPWAGIRLLLEVSIPLTKAH